MHVKSWFLKVGNLKMSLHSHKPITWPKKWKLLSFPHCNGSSLTSEWTVIAVEFSWSCLVSSTSNYNLHVYTIIFSQHAILICTKHTYLDFNVGATTGVSQPLMHATLCKTAWTAQMRMKNTATVRILVHWKKNNFDSSTFINLMWHINNISTCFNAKILIKFFPITVSSC